MSTEDPIAHACRLLREAAADLQQNSTYSLRPDDWRGETEAKAAFDEYMALADTLEAAAAQEPVATVFTMEALAPGGPFKYHATVHKPLPAGTKLYAHPQPAAQDAERIQALELEVRQLTEQIAELRGGAAYSLPEWLEVMHASEIRGIWNDCKRDGLHYVAFAWRIERLGWQRLLDALRSSRGKAPAQQPAPSAAPAVVSEREFKQFLSDVMTAAGLVTHGKQCKDLGSRLGAMCVRLRSPTPQADSTQSPAPEVGRVYLVATGEIHEGEETYTRHDNAPPPLCDSECLYTAPQADSQPAPVLWVSPEQFANLVDDDRAPSGIYLPVRKTSAGKFTMPLFADRAPADSVLEDAAHDVLAERQRQISIEGWTPEHDDEHVNDEIAAMACYYVMPQGAREWSGPDGYGNTLGEAIRPEGWDAKDCDRRRELVKGAALALAELERMDRAARKQGRAA